MELTEQHARIQQKIEQYHPAAKVIALIHKTPILLLVGIAGAGKDTIKGKLLETGHYHHIISHTTRLPRINDGVLEKDGVEYYFIDLSQAEQMLDTGEYIEANIYSGNVYGTTADDIRTAHEAGKVAVTDLEVNGVARYVAIDPKVRPVFVLPPSYAVWQQRLEKRYGGVLDPDDFRRRMATALQELEHALATPYFLFVLNDKLDDAVAEVDRLAHGGTVGATETHARQAAERIAHELQNAHASY